MYNVLKPNAPNVHKIEPIGAAINVPKHSKLFSDGYKPSLIINKPPADDASPP